MKLLKTSILFGGATLCLAACNSNPANNNAAADNGMTAAPQANATDMNATSMNAVDVNAAGNATATAPGAHKHHGGTRTDTGPRGTTSPTPQG